MNYFDSLCKQFIMMFLLSLSLSLSVSYLMTLSALVSVVSNGRVIDG